MNRMAVVETKMREYVCCRSRFGLRDLRFEVLSGRMVVKFERSDLRLASLEAL